jgi:hypothetical protein
MTAGRLRRRVPLSRPAAPVVVLLLAIAGCAAPPPDVTVNDVVGMVLRGWCAQQANCVTDHKNPRSE